MKPTDLRLVEIQQRDGMAFGLKEIISTLVGGSILLMLGLFAYSKVGSKIDQSSFTAQENATMVSIRSNVTSGFDLTSMIFYIAAIVGIIGVIWLAFR